MMRNGLIIPTLVCLLMLTACKEKNTVDAANSPAAELNDPLAEIEREQEEYLKNANYYVIAPSGLSLRKSSDPKSEKIASMAFGSKVRQLSPIYTIDMEVEHIPGSMMEIEYEGQKGYAFSGFLSRYPLPKKGFSTKEYSEVIQEIDAGVKFRSEDNDPDFHEGQTEVLRLPNTLWHEAYYISSSLFKIPKDLGFPNPSGEKLEVIESQLKDKDVWSSELTVYRNTTALDSIVYSFRVEGSGYSVKLKEDNQSILIEHVAFVD